MWTESIVTSYDSTYYSDGTDRQNLGVSKWVAKYFYRGIESDNHVYYTHGAQKNSAAEALNEAVPAAPSLITSHAVYIGKIVIRYNATNGTAYPRAWGESLQSAGAVNHNDLANRDEAGNHAKIVPLADGTTAFQITKSDGTTAILSADTTNDVLQTKITNYEDNVTDGNDNSE